MEIRHICQGCNKEFVIPERSIDENNAGKFITTVVCPYCNIQNQIWIRIMN